MNGTPQDLHTLNDIFFAAIERNDARLVSFRRDGKWLPISAAEFYASVAAIARQLEAWGVRKGDRVALLSENRPEWAMVDFACLMLGAVVVPIYATQTAEQVTYMLRDSQSGFVFVSDQKQVDKVKPLARELQKIVVMEEVADPAVLRLSQITNGAPRERDSALDQRARSIQPADLATIIYTSGTTGTSKGAMLTHGNIASNMAFSLKTFQFTSGEVCISFLPLSHVTARHLDYCLFMRGVEIAYCPDMNQLATYFLEVRPTLIVAVPRVYEKTREKAEATARGFLRHQLYRWCLHVGNAHLAQTLAGQTPASVSWRIADLLLYSRIRKGFGGRPRVFISGGAPLGMDLARWYALIGVRIHEGYGLTETSPVIAINTPEAHRLGTVGKPLPNLEYALAEDGELLVRGPSVFVGYWNREKETQEAFTEFHGTPGWFKTGDIATIDADGFLAITDRKKDLIKTSGGKFIAPQPIEGRLKANTFIAEAAVLGDRRRFPAALIAPDFSALEDWALANGVTFHGRRELVAHPKVRALYDGIVQTLNQELAHYEQLKKVLLVPDEFSVESGELTPSLKLKRRVVEQKYRPQIDALYAESAPVPAHAS